MSRSKSNSVLPQINRYYGEKDEGKAYKDLTGKTITIRLLLDKLSTNNQTQSDYCSERVIEYGLEQQTRWSSIEAIPFVQPYFDSCLDKIIFLKVFYAFVLLFDVTIAQNYGPWSNMYTNRGPRPNYQDTAIRANSKRSTVPKRRSFTDVQKEALKSEVMCDVFETLNESRKQSAMMADKQRALEELEERIQDSFKIIKYSLHWII